MTEELGEYKVDKSGWDDGPWMNEPDKVLWQYKGLDCMIVRNKFGALCGYVGVHAGHPWFARNYNDVDASVHGGLTYADYCVGHICHPSPIQTYWLGFDCAHSMDFIPRIAATLKRIGAEHLPFPGETYKDIAYVTVQVEKLAEQAIVAGGLQ